MYHLKQGTDSKLKNLRYANINAKLKGMHSKFLSKEELEQLAKQNDFKNAVYFLKNEFEVLDNINETSDRRIIERELDKTIIEDIEKIKKVLNSNDKELFCLFISRYEIICITESLKKIIYKNDLSDSRVYISIWTDKVFKRIKGIENAKNIQQYIEIINKTKYCKDVNEYLEKKEVNFAQLDTKLNKTYFKELYNKAKIVRGKTLELIGENIDLLNLSWIYRMKKYYKMSSKMIEQKLIDVNYKLDKKAVEKLLELDDIEEIKELLKSTSYGKIVGDLSANNLDLEVNKFLLKKYRKTFISAEYNISTVISYIMLKEFQKQNIINILGAISYKIDKKEILKRIITYD